MNATGGQAAEPWRLRFQVVGVQSNGTTASTLRFGLRLNGTVQKQISLAMGTTARTNRPWLFECDIQQDGAGVVARLMLHVDGVAAPAPALVWLPSVPDWADWAIEYGWAAAVAGTSATVRSGCAWGARGIGGGV